MYLIKNLYPEFTKNFYNSIIENQSNEKWPKILTDSSPKKTYEYLINIQKDAQDH